MKRIYANEDVCIGCRLCEIYCQVAHSESKDIIRTFKHDKVRPMPRVLVEEARPVSLALQCRHCHEPVCVYACITGAMHKNGDGRVAHDAARCIGCWTCILVCPYGAIRRDEQARRVAAKCDLCPDLDTPACVAHCPNEALRLVEE